MPEWLLQKENYRPQTDQDTFIHKSILSLLHILSRIRRQSSCAAASSPINPVLKVASVVFLILLLSLARNLAFVLTANVCLLLILSMLRGEDILAALKSAFAAFLFAFILLLPAAFFGNHESLVMITPKVFAAVLAVNILSRSTPWHGITGALKAFFIPDLFILVLDITIKYILLLGDFSLHMLYALKLRSVGKNQNKYASLSGIAGTMFLKSKEMSEEMYAAMECRGFTGEYSTGKNQSFSFADFIFVLANITLFLTFIFWGKV